MSVVRDIPPFAAADHSATSGAPLRAAGLSVSYGDQAVIVGVDLTVAAGETVAIVGRSGCGKTTLLHALAGLVPPVAGSVASDPAALMPQRDGLLPWASARDNAALPLRVGGTPKREARALATAQLQALGLGDVANRPIGLLSGGMRQRVALARTLLTGRRLLLLDEPLAAVDALTRAELHALLLEHLGTEGRSAVLVTHDLDEAVHLANRVLVLQLRGKTGSTLVTGPTLVGRPGDHLEDRGGRPVRDALMELLGG